MRLATLAKKVEITPNELKKYLISLDIELDSGSNTKLDNETVTKVLDHFGYNVSEELESTTPDEEIADESEVIAIEEEENQVENIRDDESITAVTEEVTEEIGSNGDELEDERREEEREQDETEVIRAPKVSLPGLTVKGKIDLPEPKVKEEPTEKTEPKGEKESKKDSVEGRKGKTKGRRGRRRGDDYNPIAAARKRKEKEDEKKREREAREKKELRRKRYENMVKSRPSSTIKPKTKQLQKTQDFQMPPKPEYSGNIFKRIWQWLNSY